MPTPEERLQELGVSLPAPAVPVAAYVPCVRTGNLVYVSGQVPGVDGKPTHLGHLGGEVGLEDGRAAARTCAVNVLAALKAELGQLSQIR
ncbi:MAG TPA: RidA family protein, partial [Actinomycetota bacterium]|nr:RidA family protein [Actinomycetota bacterium]